jgi:hypothetical protein
MTMPATKVTGPPIILIRVAPAMREKQHRDTDSLAFRLGQPTI